MKFSLLSNTFFGIIYGLVTIFSLIFEGSASTYYVEYIHVAWIFTRPHEEGMILILHCISLVLDWMSSIENTDRWLDYIVSFIMSIHFVAGFTEYLVAMKYEVDLWKYERGIIPKRKIHDIVKLVLVIMIDIFSYSMYYSLIPYVLVISWAPYTKHRLWIELLLISTTISELALQPSTFVIVIVSILIAYSFIHLYN